MSRRIGLVIVALLLSSGCGNIQTRAHDPQGAPALAPTHEDRDAGLVGVAPGFAIGAIRTIAIAPVTVSDTTIDSDEDRELARTVPARFQARLAEELRATRLFDRVVSGPDVPPAGGDGLRLDTVITHLTGGSRHLRFWVGLGAGRSKVQIETRFVDPTGRVVVVTADRRVGAMSEAMSLDYGGSGKQLIEQSVNDMARDLAKFLVRLHQGKAPAPRD
jgi:hypothetical protein